jgi:hypothetical protein
MTAISTTAPASTGDWLLVPLFVLFLPLILLSRLVRAI